MTTFDPPNGSRIKIKKVFDGVTLFWKKPGGGPFRYLIVGFLLLWLCGWLAGFIFAGRDLLAGKGPVGFIVAWLAGWTLGGVVAMVVIYLLLRPQAPESVTLERSQFKYDTGTAPLYVLNPYWILSKKQHMNPFSMLFQKRKTYQVDRSECPAFVLEGFGDEQRLRFDVGADRVVIGESLKEPEREWLARILAEWRNA